MNGLEIAPGYPVEARDATGAGDSFDGAVIYGYLKGLDLPALGTLANATGAAKVRKLGTGHNMPWPAEITEVLARYGEGDQDFGLPT
jgi:sugar/nucleoside kinase (ribokinase family)